MLSQGALPSGHGSPSAQLAGELSQGQCTPRGPGPRQRVLSPPSVRWVSCPGKAFLCRCWYEEQSSGAARSRLLMVKHWRDHMWPRDLRWIGGHLTGASYPVSCCSCQFPPRGGQGSPGCKCCGWCHMSRGGDWVRSELQLWPNSSLGAGVEKGEQCRLFLHPGSAHWAQSPAPPEALARGLGPGLPRSGGTTVSRRHSQSVTRN